MKKTIFVTLILGLFLAVWGFSPNQTAEEKIFVTILTKILEINHYSGNTVDD